MSETENQPNSTSIFQTIFDQLTTGIGLLDAEGRILRINAGLKMMLERNDRSGAIKQFEDLFHSSAVDSARAYFKQVTEGELRTEPRRLRLKGRDGKPLWVAVTITALDQSAEADPCRLLQVEDITALKSLEAQLQQVQNPEAISVFAGGITHSFNNILSSIQGNAEYALRHELKEDDPGAYSVQQIMKAARRAGSLTKQILTLSRWKVPELSPINLTPIVKEVAKFLKTTIPGSITLRLSLRARSDRVLADPVTVHQMLMILCSRAMNAIMPDGGVIDIHISETEAGPRNPADASAPPRIAICVSAGHDPSSLPETPVIDIPPSAADGAPGEIAVPEALNRILQELQAAVHITGTAGVGLQQTVVLSLQSEPAEAEQDHTAAMTGGCEHILFVDDDEQIVEFMERSLGMLGYAFTGKCCSMEALELFTSSPEQFDLIISDLNMEEMTGDRLAEKIRGLKPDLPIIICTGYDEMLGNGRAEQIGIDAVLNKPFMMDELDTTIRRVLQEKKGRGQNG